MNNKLVLSMASGALLFGAAALADTKDPVVEAYFKVEQAVIDQDLSAAKAAATDLAQKAQAANNEAISKDADALAKTDSIDQARQAFKALSEDNAEPHSKAGEDSQKTACAMGNAQCMQTSTRSSCGDTRTPSCGMMGMMRSMRAGGCPGMGS